ncbi:MAG: carbohydrate kinase [Deltaproteobacteria bacterium]|jgi:sugar/nucleoside kinase (ribokinase family)|nr:carbohydrate kinase [Deltaproteobacteria bacterium]
MFDITALGEILIDFTPGGETADGFRLFIRNPGGAPANLLCQAAACGARTAFIGKAGKDEFGAYLLETLERRGVDCSGMRFDPKVGTTLAFVHLAEGGERSFSFYRDPGADATLSPGEVDLGLVARSKVFHFGSLSLTHGPCRASTLAALSEAKANGVTVSFDPNWRPLLWDGPEAFRDRALPLLDRVDVLKVSETEAEILSGAAGGTFEAAGRLRAMGPRVVLISLGSRGARISAPGLEAFCPPYPVEPVDTTGAGDCFHGAFLASLCLSGGTLDGQKPDDWKRHLALAAAAGALATTRKGGMGAAGPFEEAAKAAEDLVPLVALRE